MPAKKKIPLIDLRKELLLQVDGEEEKKHTLKWDILKNIGDATQNLIYKLARYSLEDNTLPPESLKLEFVGFHPGSAVPDFRLAPQSNLLFNSDKPYNKLNKDFNLVLSSIDKGNFQSIADKYNEPSVKNEIIDAVYDFTNAAGTKPFAVVRKATGEKKYVPLAKVRRMSPKVKGLLHVSNDKKEQVSEGEEVKAVGEFILKTSKYGRKTKKNVHLYTEKEAILSLAYDSIETDSRIYVLNSEVHFTITEDTKTHSSIENHLLDIYASGENLEDAKKDLFEQFDYTYRRLNQVVDSKLSKHLLRAKKYINLIVEKVKDK